MDEPYRASKPFGDPTRYYAGSIGTESRQPWLPSQLSFDDHEAPSLDPIHDVESRIASLLDANAERLIREAKRQWYEPCFGRKPDCFRAVTSSRPQVDPVHP